MTEQKIPLNNINMAAIPLDNRAGRRLLRDIIEKYSEELEAERVAFDPDMSMEDYMVKVRAVRVIELGHMDKIDALPDEEYVDALHAFKKGLIKTYHDDAVAKGETKENIYQWCLKHFREEFSQIGRRDAEAEISAESPDAPMPPPPSVFVVAFDGTVVEDQYPGLGSESPFAIATMKALQKNGHAVLIWHNRDDVEYRDMMTMMAMGDFVPNGTLTTMLAGDQPFSSIVFPDSVGEDTVGNIDLFKGEDGAPLEKIHVDYLVHNASYQAARIAITGDANNTSFYWGDLVSLLMDDMYISQEDHQEILDSMSDAA